MMQADLVIRIEAERYSFEADPVGCHSCYVIVPQPTQDLTTGLYPRYLRKNAGLPVTGLLHNRGVPFGIELQPTGVSNPDDQDVTRSEACPLLVKRSLQLAQ